MTPPATPSTDRGSSRIVSASDSEDSKTDKQYEDIVKEAQRIQTRESNEALAGVSLTVSMEEMRQNLPH